MNPQIEPLLEGKSSDVRVQATSKIWSYSVAIMAIAIPITAITGSVIVPIMVVVSPALATLAVWYFGAKNHPGTSISAPNHQAEIATQRRIEELEERLANLETINNFERRLAEESLKRDHDRADIVRRIEPQLEAE